VDSSEDWKAEEAVVGNIASLDIAAEEGPVDRTGKAADDTVACSSLVEDVELALVDDTVMSVEAMDIFEKSLSNPKVPMPLLGRDSLSERGFEEHKAAIVLRVRAFEASFRGLRADMEQSGHRESTLFHPPEEIFL